MSSVYIGFGSNVGNRVGTIISALAYLKANENISITKISGLYETEPVGFVGQNDFINGVVCVETKLCPMDLLLVCQNIEKKLGRERSIRWGPRTIDLDILLYDDLVQNTEKLTIPHKELARRRFVLQPLAEIAADAIEPVSKKNISRLLKETPDDSRIQLAGTSTELLSMIKKV